MRTLTAQGTISRLTQRVTITNTTASTHSHPTSTPFKNISVLVSSGLQASRYHDYDLLLHKARHPQSASFHTYLRQQHQRRHFLLPHHQQQHQRRNSSRSSSRSSSSVVHQPLLHLPYRPNPTPTLVPIPRMASTAAVPGDVPGRAAAATSTSAAPGSSQPGLPTNQGASPSEDVLQQQPHLPKPSVSDGGVGGEVETLINTTTATTTATTTNSSSGGGGGGSGGLSTSEVVGGEGDDKQAHAIPALPAPPEGEEGASRTLEVDGKAVALDHLGPMVVGRDGTVSRIANWGEMTELERRNTLRILCKRNQVRLATLRGETDEKI